ncbi:glycoside hydrolase family 125 protein [Sphingomonas adhaesiva]|uniref:glycoside hydrolase family 125 protein n=1 Tax=Sphingomonas adhaesiva TaxID=28212 RepID=UPI002FF9F5ED
MTAVPPADCTRRAVIAGAAAAACATMPAARALATPLPTRRPPLAERRFVSRAVEAQIMRVAARIGDPQLAWLFANCYPNTLDTTVEIGTVDGRDDTFVITGDIPCMWLRDSAAQVHGYLPLARRDPALRRLLRGLIGRHARCILIDPYANAFTRSATDATPLSWAKDDLTTMTPGVAERKWELDSLCHVVRLAHGYWRATRDGTPFDAQWGEAARRIVATFRAEQRKDGGSPYRFQRAAESATDTLILDGHGAPTRKVGLIHSMFRPSDDACVYPFLVPANLFAVAALRWLAELAHEVRGDAALAMQALALADEVNAALRRHALIGEGDAAIWAYEIDGYGNALFMDDANAPSLSSLALLGCVERDDATFRRTEARCWSADNPYFFTGRAGEGIGGPHVGLGMIWPMSLIVRAMSSDDDAVIRRCLQVLKTSHAGTGFMHEAFAASDPTRFTRPWFAWANALFGEMILDLAARRPGVLA